MYRSLIFSLSIPCLFTMAVKIPEPCPNVPKTQFDCSNIKLSRDILLALPFYKHPSNFFVEISPLIDHNAAVKLNITSFEIRTTVFPEFDNWGSTSHGVAEIDRSNNKWEIYLSTSVNDRIKGPDATTLNVPSKCRPPLKEEIRMWCDDEFVIFWSCAGNPNDRSWHDEALLVTIQSTKRKVNLSNFTEYNLMMERFNKTARNYVTEYLLSEVDWTKRTTNVVPKIVFNQFNCDSGFINSRYVYIFLVIAATLFLGNLVYVCYGKYKNN